MFEAAYEIAKDDDSHLTVIVTIGQEKPATHMVYNAPEDLVDRSKYVQKFAGELLRKRYMTSSPLSAVTQSDTKGLVRIED